MTATSQDPTLLAAQVVYLTRLNELQKDLIISYRDFLSKTNQEQTLSNTEFSLGVRCQFLQKDNDALRELAEEYRRLAHGGQEHRA